MKRALKNRADIVLQRYLHADYRDRRPSDAQRLRTRILQCDARGYAAACRAVACVDWFDQLEQIRVPALVIAGARDVGAPPEMARALASRITGSTLAIIDDASHLSVIEAPEQFGSLVGRFLAGL